MGNSQSSADALVSYDCPDRYVAFNYEVTTEQNQRSIAQAPPQRTDSENLEYDSLNTNVPDLLIIASYSYRARKPSELSFKKGDHIRVIDHCEPGWWLGRHVISDRQGLLPAIHMAKESVDTRK